MTGTAGSMPEREGNDQWSSTDDPKPIVDLPRAGLPGAAIAGFAIVAALGLFLVLNGQRQTAARPASEESGSTGTFSPPPPLLIPAESRPMPPTVTVVTEPTPAITASRPSVQLPMSVPAPSTIIVPQPLAATSVSTPQDRPAPGSRAPAIVYDAGVDQTAVVPNGGTDQASRNSQGQGGGNGSGDAPARATLIGDRSNVMPTGTVITAVLETPIDTARPGLVRAVVSQDTRGFDGRRVLVSRGSRLIGEYQADVRANQHRVLVTWTRLIRPDGVSIRLGSPAADPLGGAGVPGRLHSYFLERFASAVLQSALTVGVSLASQRANNSVIVGLPGTTVNNVVGSGPLTSSTFQPKITVKQGAAVNVFVARDLDFSGVPSRP